LLSLSLVFLCTTGIVAQDDDAPDEGDQPEETVDGDEDDTGDDSTEEGGSEDADDEGDETDQEEGDSSDADDDENSDTNQDEPGESDSDEEGKEEAESTEEEAPATLADQEVPEQKQNRQLSPDRWGIGGQYAFGLTSNLKNSNGDFPMSDMRAFFTNRQYGVAENITADRGADRLNRPEGDDLGLDFYFHIKPKDPQNPDSVEVKAFTSINFETARLGTMFSSGTHANRFYIRDAFITIADFITPGLTLWLGDRKRAGLGMPTTFYRPSQDDTRIRGFGADYFLLKKFMISLDFGVHLLVKTTETINADLATDPNAPVNIIKEEYVGYVPLGVGGNPLTSDYYLFIDNANSQRMRKIQTIRGRFEMPVGSEGYEDAKMVWAVAGAYEWVYASDGNRLISNRGDRNYGQWLFPKNMTEEEQLGFPFDWGFKAGGELNILLNKDMELRIGLGYSAGISTLPVGPSREFLSLVTQDLQSGLPREERIFDTVNAKRLNQQRATTFGIGFEIQKPMFNLQLEGDAKIGSIFGLGEEVLRNFSADRLGQAESTLIFINGRYTHFFNDLFKLAVDASVEMKLLSQTEIDEVVKYFNPGFDPLLGDKVGYMLRLFLLPGINIGEKNVDGNSIYAQVGLSMFNRTIQMLQQYGTEKSARVQFYLGLQSRFIF